MFSEIAKIMSLDTKMTSNRLGKIVFKFDYEYTTTIYSQDLTTTTTIKPNNVLTYLAINVSNFVTFTIIKLYHEVWRSKNWVLHSS